MILLSPFLIFIPQTPKSFSTSHSHSCLHFQTPFSPQDFAWPRGLMRKLKIFLKVGQAFVFPPDAYVKFMEVGMKIPQ